MSVAQVPIPEGFLQEWCEQCADGTEMPPYAFLPQGLAFMSALAASRVQIRWNKTYSERCNLWILTPGRSGLGGKTSTGASLRLALRIARRELGDQIQVLNGARTSDAGLAESLDVLSQDQAAAEREEKRLAKEQDRDPIQVEAQVRSPLVGHVLSFNEIGAIWGGDGNAQYIEAARQFLLDVYDGWVSSNTKQTKVPEQPVCVTATGNIPWSEFDGKTNIGTLRSGFAGRWLIIARPDPTNHIATPKLGQDEDTQELERLIENMVSWVKASPSYIVVNNLLTEEAEEARQQWYFSRRQGILKLTGEMDEALAEVWQRYQSTALKLAVYSAMSRNFSNKFCATLSQIKVEKRDVIWGQLVAEESLGALRERISGSIGTIGDRVIKRLRDNGATDQETAVATRTLYRSLKLTSDQLTKELHHLQELQLVDAAYSETGAKVVWLNDPEEVLS